MTRASAVLHSLREATVTMLAVLATFGCAMLIDPEPGPVTLAVVLTISLARSHLDRDRHGRLESAVGLSLAALASIGVGALLRFTPIIGAAVFVLGMAASISLRRFGPRGRRLGSLLALPFVAILIIPRVHSARFGVVGSILLPIGIALLALLWVSVFQGVARRAGFLPPTAPRADAPHSATSSLRPGPSTRMAVQMAVALTVAFAVGLALFPERWAWIVLTAFIVNSGNRGRGDVAYKSVLRVIGAGLGTAAALLIGVTLGAPGFATIVLILGAVFLGLWLRPLGYAWWALFVTVALALLQGFERSPQFLLPQRLEEIVIGAVIGVASAWFVLPVRSLAVLRRRIADALAALQTALDPAALGSGSAATFIAAMERVREVAPVFRVLWRSSPALWLRTLEECEGPAIAVIEAGGRQADIRRAVGNARRSLRDESAFGSSLVELRRTLPGV